MIRLTSSTSGHGRRYPIAVSPRTRQPWVGWRPLVAANLSKNHVNWAGDVLRGYTLGASSRRPVDDPASLVDAVETIAAWRASHALPLTRVAVGLRYYVEKHTVKRPIVVAQRLKRFPTLVDKLRREPGMKLARMWDIGGCRAVLEAEEEIRQISTHLRRRWDVAGERDYIRYPRAESGYRAVHLVVRKGGRLIEVQLRTGRQHAWAEIVESVDRLNDGLNLKSGEAPAELVEYHRLGAALLASLDAGLEPDAEVLSRFRRLHPKVASYTTSNRAPDGS